VAVITSKAEFVVPDRASEGARGNTLDSQFIHAAWRAGWQALAEGNVDEAATQFARTTLLARASDDPLYETAQAAEQLTLHLRDAALQREQHRHALEQAEQLVQRLHEQLEALYAGPEVPRPVGLLGRILSAAGVRPHLAQPVVKLESPTLEPPAQVDAPSARADTTPEPAPPQMHRVAVHMLGEFHITIDDQPMQKMNSRRNRNLLAYLIVNRAQPMLRDVLMDAFWPDAGEKAARNSLNVALFNLRRAFTAVHNVDIVLFENGAYQINPSLVLWVDADEFMRAIEAGQKAEAEESIASFESAIALYRGDFMAEAPYEDWAAQTREWLRLMYLDALDRLSRIYLERGQYAACIGLCQLILTKDDCREDAHCLLMRCYARQDQHHLALRQYEACVAALQRELNVTPTPATQALAARIRKHTPV
jgi:DNA-binding SARP family transcriptional activator